MVQKVNDRCCGCGACENVCPVGAIHYISDHNGFYKPVVEDKCIHCGLCLKRCPLEKPLEGNALQAVYACRNQDMQIVQKSSSGGVFASLAAKILDEGGCVFGCSWDGMRTKHVEVDDVTQLPKLYKSKYLQSDMTGVHTQIENRLKEGKIVLFCGTPCQVAGLKSGLGEMYSKLITVDFICHGIPSPKVFQKYLQGLENKHQSKVTNVCFRDKDYGWKESQMTVSFTDGSTYSKPAAQDSYYRAFLCNLSLNQSCGDCKFNRLPRVSDITLGDFWNVEKYHEQFCDNKGASCVILNSDAGVSLFQTIQSQLHTQPSSAKSVLDGNPFLNGHCTLHKRRETFFAGLEEEPLDDLVSRCLKPTPLEWLVEVLKYKLGIQ